MHGSVLLRARTNRDVALKLLRGWGGGQPIKGLKTFHFAVNLCNICIVAFFMWGLLNEATLMQCVSSLDNSGDEWGILFMISVERLSLCVLLLTILFRMTAFGLNISGSWFYLNRDLHTAIEKVRQERAAEDEVTRLLKSIDKNYRERDE